ncbi:MAG: PilN domain-containing protein [Rhizomicrobium sp.]
MSAEGARAAQWLGMLRAGWQWWRDEIAALLPDGLRRQMASGVAIVAIDLESEAVVLRRFAADDVSEIARIPRPQFGAASLRAALAPYLAGPRLLRDSFALRLPDGTALRRNLSLPLAARGNLASLLDIELERQSPLEPGEVYHDYRVLRTDRRAARIDIEWRIVRRRSVEAALEICRQAGVELAVIAFIGDAAPPDGGDFPVVPRASLALRLRRRLVPGLLLLIAVLLLAVAAGAYGRNQAALDDFSMQRDEARSAARGSLLLEHQIAAARRRAALLLQEKQRPSVSRMLAETTQLLPDGSWLTVFAYRDGEVRIQGFSNAASSLIALFDASPLFTGAEFRAPLTQAQGSGLDQFDLAVRLRRGAR